MSQQLLILAAVAMAALAVLRVVRVRLGRTPHPDGILRVPFILAFIFVPPIVLSALTQPAAASSLLRGIAWMPPYLIFLGLFALLMGIVAIVVRLIAPGRSRPLLLLALVASEGDPDDVPFDPPVTAKLAASVASVDRANAVFPRGVEFPAQIEHAGFRYAWDALEVATAALEGGIAADRRLGLGVAAAARATAADARSRLDTLRRLAVDHGQAWAT